MIKTQLIGGFEISNKLKMFYKPQIHITIYIHVMHVRRVCSLLDFLFLMFFVNISQIFYISFLLL